MNQVNYLRMIVDITKIKLVVMRYLQEYMNRSDRLEEGFML